MSATQEKYPGVPKWHIPKLTRDQHPTALDIIKRDNVSLVNKTVLVTGGSAGIGIETVRAFASAGARVFVLVRSVDKTRVILNKINAEYPQNGGLEIVQGELDSLASVNAAANDFLKRSDQLNILVNNAGIYQAPFALTVDGYESHLAIDHIAHQLLFKKLLPLLIKSSTPQFHSRVVAVASTVHILANVDFADLNYTNGRPYTHSSAYNQAKLANIWFANHVEKLYGSQGVHGLSLHPGLIQTESLFNAPRENMINSGMFTPEGDYRFPGLAKDEEQGAATTVWASVSSDLEGKGGLYLEDVAIAKPATPGVLKGYTSAAVDETQATKMWDWTEQAISKFVTA